MKLTRVEFFFLAATIWIAAMILVWGAGLGGFLVAGLHLGIDFSPTVITT
jgi:hypothetical protein